MSLKRNILTIKQNTPWSRWGYGLISTLVVDICPSYRGAKSLAQPGRKQALATEDFDIHISYL